jgi:hypothetical protein
MNWHKRFKAMKLYMSWTNADIAEITGNTPESVATITQPSRDFPRSLKVAIVVFEILTDNKI